MSTQPPAPQPTGGLGTAKPDTTSQIDNPVLPPDLDSFFNRGKEKKPAAEKPVETKPIETKPDEVKPTEEKPVETKPVEKVEKPTEEVEVDEENPFLSAILSDKEEKKAAEKKKDEEKKPAEATEDDFKLPEGELTGKAAEKAVREAFVHQKKKYQEKIASLEEQLKGVTAGEPPKEVVEKLTKYEGEIEALKKTIEDQEQFVAVANVEMSQQFKKTVAEPREQIKRDLVRIANENGGAANGVLASDIWSAILTGDNTKLAESVSKLNEVDKLEVMTIKKDLKNITLTEKTLRENAKVSLEAFEKAQKEQAETFTKNITKAYETQFQAKKEKVIEQLGKDIFTKIEGADEWNKAVEQAIEFQDRLGKIDPRKLTTEDIAGLVNYTSAIPTLEYQVKTFKAEIKRLKARLKDKYSSQPTAGGKGGKSPEAAKPQAQASTVEEFFARRKK